MNREINSDGYLLESQIRDAFGRVTYTQTCHNKHANRLIKYDSRLKNTQIVLNALTTSGILATIISLEQYLAIISGIVSFLSLIFGAYTKNLGFSEDAIAHQKSANELWLLREEYISLLTDFTSLSHDEIIAKRDDLQLRTFEVYSNSPQTDEKSYRETQRALKTEEEQTFTNEEVDVMLPKALRRTEQAKQQKD